MKNIFIVVIIMLVLLLPAVSAQIAIDSFTSMPEKVLPGEEVLLELSVENVGDEDIENVIVTLDLAQVPFAPAASSNEKVLDEIEEHDHEMVYFTIKALPTAEPQVYKIPVTISYGTFSKTSVIGVEVQAKANLDLLLDSSEVVQVGDQGKVSLKFVNNGLAQVKFLKVTLRESTLYTILSPQTVYIGEVDVGDFETEDFIIKPSINNPILIVDLEYNDAANHKFTETKLLQLKVYSPEEAKQLGLVQSKNSYTAIIVAVIVLLVGVYLYRRRKKRQKNAP